eukprot:gnl/Chilomastix_cuspidata/1607.p1 GENE.gnl/Chilomastix_cuspidata/1607~~gnl/Chilomastix_cuspidata/1607.p1  ORF type:complete len:2100 (+),score=671.35 gnl/Chilomastix_cuspidata/1607:31-6330(+)
MDHLLPHIQLRNALDALHKGLTGRSSRKDPNRLIISQITKDTKKLCEKTISKMKKEPNLFAKMIALHPNSFQKCFILSLTIYETQTMSVALRGISFLAEHGLLADRAPVDIGKCLGVDAPKDLRGSAHATEGATLSQQCVHLVLDAYSEHQSESTHRDRCDTIRAITEAEWENFAPGTFLAAAKTLTTIFEVAIQAETRRSAKKALQHILFSAVAHSELTRSSLTIGNLISFMKEKPLPSVCKHIHEIGVKSFNLSLQLILAAISVLGPATLADPLVRHQIAAPALSIAVRSLSSRFVPTLRWGIGIVEHLLVLFGSGEPFAAAFGNALESILFLADSKHIALPLQLEALSSVPRLLGGHAPLDPFIGTKMPFNIPETGVAAEKFFRWVSLQPQFSGFDVHGAVAAHRSRPGRVLSDILLHHDLAPGGAPLGQRLVDFATGSTVAKLMLTPSRTPLLGSSTNEERDFRLEEAHRSGADQLPTVSMTRAPIFLSDPATLKDGMAVIKVEKNTSTTGLAGSRFAFPSKDEPDTWFYGPVSAPVFDEALCGAPGFPKSEFVLCSPFACQLYGSIEAVRAFHALVVDCLAAGHTASPDGAAAGARRDAFENQGADRAEPGEGRELVLAAKAREAARRTGDGRLIITRAVADSIQQSKQLLKRVFASVEARNFDAVRQLGLDPACPGDIARVFIEMSCVRPILLNGFGVSMDAMGEFLGKSGEFPQEVMREMCWQISHDARWSDESVIEALRSFLRHFKMEGESQIIDRTLDIFSEVFLTRFPDFVINDEDILFPFIFACIMLNTDQHNASMEEADRMRCEDFVRNTRGVDRNGVMTDEFLAEVFHNIKNNAFTIDMLEDMKVAEADRRAGEPFRADEEYDKVFGRSKELREIKKMISELHRLFKRTQPTAALLAAGECLTHPGQRAIKGDVHGILRDKGVEKVTPSFADIRSAREAAGGDEKRPPAPSVKTEPQALLLARLFPEDLVPVFRALPADKQPVFGLSFISDLFAPRLFQLISSFKAQAGMPEANPNLAGDSSVTLLITALRELSALATVAPLKMGNLLPTCFKVAADASQIVTMSGDSNLHVLRLQTLHIRLALFALELATNPTFSDNLINEWAYTLRFVSELGNLQRFDRSDIKQITRRLGAEEAERFRQYFENSNKLRQTSDIAPPIRQLFESTVGYSPDQLETFVTHYVHEMLEEARGYSIFPREVRKHLGFMIESAAVLFEMNAARDPQTLRVIFEKLAKGLMQFFEIGSERQMCLAIETLSKIFETFLPDAKSDYLNVETLRILGNDVADLDEAELAITPSIAATPLMLVTRSRHVRVLSLLAKTISGLLAGAQETSAFAPLLLSMSLAVKRVSKQVNKQSRHREIYKLSLGIVQTAFEIIRQILCPKATGSTEDDPKSQAARKETVAENTWLDFKLSPKDRIKVIEDFPSLHEMGLKSWADVSAVQILLNVLLTQEIDSKMAQRSFVLLVGLARAVWQVEYIDFPLQTDIELPPLTLFSAAPQLRSSTDASTRDETTFSQRLTERVLFSACSESNFPVTPVNPSDRDAASIPGSSLWSSVLDYLVRCAEPLEEGIGPTYHSKFTLSQKHVANAFLQSISDVFGDERHMLLGASLEIPAFVFLSFFDVSERRARSAEQQTFVGELLQTHKEFSKRFATFLKGPKKHVASEYTIPGRYFTRGEAGSTAAHFKGFTKEFEEFLEFTFLQLFENANTGIRDWPNAKQMAPLLQNLLPAAAGIARAVSLALPYSSRLVERISNAISANFVRTKYALEIACLFLDEVCIAELPLPCWDRCLDCFKALADNILEALLCTDEKSKPGDGPTASGAGGPPAADASPDAKERTSLRVSFAESAKTQSESLLRTSSRFFGTKLFSVKESAAATPYIFLQMFVVHLQQFLFTKKDWIDKRPLFSLLDLFTTIAQRPFSKAEDLYSPFLAKQENHCVMSLVQLLSHVTDSRPELTDELYRNYISKFCISHIKGFFVRLETADVPPRATVGIENVILKEIFMLQTLPLEPARAALPSVFAISMHFLKSRVLLGRSMLRDQLIRLLQHFVSNICDFDTTQTERKLFGNFLAGAADVSPDELWDSF